MVKIENREEYMKTLKQKSIVDTEKEATKQRFGLFSQPPPIGLGDTQFEKHIPKRDEQGKPATEDRNVFAGPSRTGKGRSGYFGQMSYITLDDKYYDPGVLDRRKAKTDKLKEIKDAGPFRPQCKSMMKVKPEYEYKELMQNKKGVVVRNLDDMGKPKTMPTNVKVNGNIDQYYKFPKYQISEYDRPRQLKKEERLKHIQSMGENPPFRTWDNVKKPFNKLVLHGEEEKMPKKVIKESKPNAFPHEGVFKYPNPAKKGYNKSIGKFPAYKEDPYPIVKRKPEPAEKKEAFKLNNPHDKSRPTPSIGSMSMNLRKVMTSGMSRM